MEAVPQDPGERERLAAVLARFGEEAAAASNGVAVRLPRGAGDLAEIVRAIDAANLQVADLRLHSPTLDDVFLAKTGRSLEGAAEGDDDGGAGKGSGESEPHPTHGGEDTDGRPAAQPISR